MKVSVEYSKELTEQFVVRYYIVKDRKQSQNMEENYWAEKKDRHGDVEDFHRRLHPDTTIISVTYV